MANEKKYVEVLNDGTQDLTIRDAEAHSELAGKADKTSTYTKTEVDTKIEGAQLSNMFRLYVDPTDMHLKGQPCSQGTLEVIDGHLILHTE